MIEKLIQNKQYAQALLLLKDKSDDLSSYQRINCYFELKMYAEVVKEAKVILKVTSKYYYDIVWLYVQSLIILENDDEAILVLKEELAMPYIPNQYYDAFTITYQSLLKKQKQKDKSMTYLSDEELVKIFTTPTTNEELLVAILKLHERNVRHFLPLLKAFLKDINKPRFIKVLILELLALQRINEDISFVTSDEQMIVNPSLLDEVVNDTIYHKFEQAFNNQLLMKYPSLANQCLEVVGGYLGSIYPLTVEDDELLAIAGAINTYVFDLNQIEYKLELVEQIYEIDKCKLIELVNIIKERIEKFE